MAQTAVKKVQVQDNRTPFDSDDEMHGTDANRDERGQENDPRVEKNDSTNERESTDDHKNEKKGDGCRLGYKALFSCIKDEMDSEKLYIHLHFRDIVDTTTDTLYNYNWRRQE